ncbi:MAG: sugar ABC transporter permease [Alicyclobacillus sp.]|nr:sugar ABC transporter permease [Alicyclobacillus sp.]
MLWKAVRKANFRPTHRDAYAERKRKIDVLPYLYSMPSVVFLAVLLGVPLISVVLLSFRYANLEMPNLRGFVGLDNYIDVLTDPLFIRALIQGTVWTIGSVVGEYLIGLVTALLLNSKLPGRTIFRALIISPWLVPIVVASLTWKWLLDPNYGYINLLLLRLHLISQPIDWFGGGAIALFTLIVVNVWRSYPFYTLMILASLQVIPNELYESAELDGASSWSKFWFITFPYLKPISLVLVTLNVIWVFDNFDFIWLLTQGGPLHETDSLATLTYEYAFQDFHFGQASALAIIMILILMVPFYFFNRANRRGEVG